MLATDGDTWVHFPDANVISIGDVMNNLKRYQRVDYANGGDIRGMIAPRTPSFKWRTTPPKSWWGMARLQPGTMS
jgi:hypothetical protein